MLLSEVMELPASEINYWRDFYDIFPFPQERDDLRMARLCEAINLNTQGLGFKDKPLDFFIPKYIDNTESKPKTLEQQIEADKAFAGKLREMQARAKGN